MKIVSTTSDKKDVTITCRLLALLSKHIPFARRFCYSQSNRNRFFPAFPIVRVLLIRMNSVGVDEHSFENQMKLHFTTFLIYSVVLDHTPR